LRPPLCGVHTVGIAGVFVAKEGGVFVAAVFPKIRWRRPKEKGFCKDVQTDEEELFVA